MVYDLRSDTEIEKYKTPCPIIEGVEVFLDGYWHLLGDAIAKEGVRGHGLT